MTFRDDEPADARRRRSARAMVVVGFVIWSAGIALWASTWAGGLAASMLGGAALTLGLSRLARGSTGKATPAWEVAMPVAVSLVLISQGVGRSDFAVRAVLVGLGTMGMVLVFLHIIEERLTVERRLADRTLLDERRRLAGEVHDVVGHTLAASMLHTTAARLSIHSDPDAAIASLERAEQQGRRSMDDIRSVVRLLRDDAGLSSPQRVAGDLPELVEGFRAAGAEITYTANGRLDDLAAPIALTVYRVVQEGLTNAIRHGVGTGGIDVAIEVVSSSADTGDATSVVPSDATDGVPDRVQVRERDSGLVGVPSGVAGADRCASGQACVVIEIVNDRRVLDATVSPGSGLAGMRERVDLLGGTLEVGGSKGDRRWVLRARIPT